MYSVSHRTERTVENFENVLCFTECVRCVRLYGLIPFYTVSSLHNFQYHTVYLPLPCTIPLQFLTYRTVCIINTMSFTTSVFFSTDGKIDDDSKFGLVKVNRCLGLKVLKKKVKRGTAN